MSTDIIENIKFFFSESEFNIQEYFTYILNDICTTEKSQWLSDIMDYIDESKVLKYDNQLKKCLLIRQKAVTKKLKDIISGSNQNINILELVVVNLRHVYFSMLRETTLLRNLQNCFFRIHK